MKKRTKVILAVLLFLVLFVPFTYNYVKDYGIANEAKDAKDYVLEYYKTNDKFPSKDSFYDQFSRDLRYDSSAKSFTLKYYAKRSRSYADGGFKPKGSYDTHGTYEINSCTQLGLCTSTHLSIGQRGGSYLTSLYLTSNSGVFKYGHLMEMVILPANAQNKLVHVSSYDNNENFLFNFSSYDVSFLTLSSEKTSYITRQILTPTGKTGFTNITYTVTNCRGGNNNTAKSCILENTSIDFEFY